MKLKEKEFVHSASTSDDLLVHMYVQYIRDKKLGNTERPFLIEAEKEMMHFIFAVCLLIS